LKFSKKKPSPELLSNTWRGLLALLYDTILLLAIFFTLTALSLSLQNILPFQYNNRRILQIILFLSIYIFYIYFWIKHQQTLGMQTWKITLTSTLKNPKPTFRQTNIRCIVATFSMLCFGLGYLWPIIDPYQRTWHDIASSTILTRHH
jgi:uncharacterized RDD family membrane protein YckC